MNNSKLLRYIIAASNIVDDKKKTATAYLDMLESQTKQCPECRQNQEFGMNFCANCGRQLWDKEG